jgi:fatty acid synthase subunit beta, fungi type
VCDQLSKATPSDTGGIAAMVAHASAEYLNMAKPVELGRTAATVPLSGVNVPFHSSYLRGGVDTYRAYLSEMMREENVDPDKLVGRYIPNVIGKPFSLDCDYLQQVADLTGSQPLKDLLEA